MNLNILKLLLGIFGQGLIIAGFLLLRGGCPDNILWLNIVVTSVVYWLLGYSFGMAPVDMNDEAKRQVGGLGISWFSVVTYSICAIGFMAGCAAYGNGPEGVSFKWQILVQGALVFFLLMGLLSSAFASQKAAQIHNTERQQSRGKEDLKYTFSDLAFAAENAPGLDPAIRQRLKDLSQATRFITPCNTPEARMADQRIFNLANQLRPALFQPQLNSAQIQGLIASLESALNQRRQILN